MGSRFNMQHFCLNRTDFLLSCWEIPFLEDEADVLESQAGCFASRAGRPACLSPAPCSEKSRSNTLRQAPAFDVLPHRSERLSFPRSVVSAAWHAGARCLFEQGPSRSPLLLLSLHRSCFFPAAHYWS